MKNILTQNLKKLLTVVVFFSLSFVVNAQIVNIPDANFKNVLIGNASINTNLDAEIQVSEANIYGGFLNVNSQNISDLTGIEAFTNIDNLNCSDNQLTSLDLSSNTNLQYLYCGNNLLTSINVSSNASLLNLVANDNQLSSIDLSNNFTLEVLFLGNNFLTNIDVSNNGVLTSLDLTNNQLTGINLANNSQLQSLLLNDNQLSNLSVFNLLNLTEIRCANNPITSLDLSNNSLLSTIVVFNCSALTSLNLKNINVFSIGFLNATGNTNLSCVSVDDVANFNANWSFAIDGITIYNLNCDAFVNIPDGVFKSALTSNSIINPNLDGEITFGEAAAYTGSIAVNYLGVSDLTGIEAFVNLTDLICSNNSLSTLDLTSNSKLQSVDCSFNNLTSFSTPLTNTLTDLNCSNNQISSIFLDDVSGLVNFDCSYNTNLTSISVIQNSSLQTLDVSHCDISALDLSFNPLLTSLKCGTNNLTSLSLNDTPLISYLDFSDNGINSIDVSFIQNVEYIDASSNPISSIDLSSNNLITSFFINYTSITAVPTFNNPGVLEALGVAGLGLSSIDLSIYPQLTKLNCASNNLSSIDFSANPNLGYFICNNNTLTALDFTTSLNLYTLDCSDNALTSLSVKNGTFTIYDAFDATNNPLLTCIEVDDVSYFNSTWSTGKDVGANYNTVCGACLVNIPDAAFKAALVADDLIDTNFDDEIQCAEASAFNGTIDVNGLGISDLTGIEAFVNITELNCTSNLLTSIDITANTTLNNLFCGSNQLTNLDISNNSALTNLGCGNNLLTSIDVTSNTALVYLDCELNQISSLNVAANTAITFLSCGGNQLSSINVTSNTLLSTLTCGNNSFTSLDVTANTALSWLDCRDNQLTSLDVTNNTALNILICFNNNLTSIDLSANSLLTLLSCSGNQLTSLNVSANSALNTLGCSNNNLASLNVANGNNNILTSFSATNNPSLSCIQVSDLTFMNANFAGLGSKDAGATYSTICPLPCIVNIPDAAFKTALVGDLTINTNADTEIQCAEAAAFTGNINVQNLGISDLTGIEAFTSIPALYCDQNSLTTIDVSNNTALIELSVANNQLTSLNVSNNLLLFQLFCNNNQLTSIDVSNNTALFRLISNVNNISSINLTNNTALSIFDISNNLLTGLDVSQNTALTQLTCTNNQITTLNTSTNTTLTDLKCNDNQLSALVLPATNSLQLLNCHNNFLTSLNTSSNPNIGTLNCSNNLCASLDFSNNAVVVLRVGNQPLLTSLNIQNGINNFMNIWDALNCPLLTCIQVDNASYMNTNWSAAKDAGATYSTICPLPCLVNIPDASFKNALLAIPGLDANSDSEVQCTEAAAYIGVLNLDNSGIADLTGIEAFVNVSSLFCNNNIIGSLDISANTALTTLSCNLNSLSSLNVSANTSLTYLSCSDNNLLNLDVSNNLNLNYLDCRNTGLNNIDLTSNLVLEYLYADGNNLNTINLSSNTILKLLNCYNCSLVSLDVSANTLLEELGCASNSISNLDVSNNNALTYINCADNFLNVLNIQNGNNLSLTLFSAVLNPPLVCIQVDNVAQMNTAWSAAIDAGATYSTICPLPCVVNIPDANFKASLIADITINTNADTEIQCSEATAYSGAINVSNLLITDLTGIEAFTNTYFIDCSNNSLTSINVSSNTALTTLWCFNNSLTGLDVSSNTLLSNLNCVNNPLGSIDVSNNLQLTSLACDNNSLSSLDVSNNTLLNLLYCQDNSISSLDLSNNPLLTGLFCVTNNLTSLDLSIHTGLQFLDCRFNSLSSLNVQNGNNTNFVNFNALFNPSLNCIQVDNVGYMNSTWSAGKDATAGFSTDCSCIVNIPDNNFKNALLANASINTNSDGVISCTEATAYNGIITVNALAISDLTGIEAFTSIIELACNSNNLTSLDLSANVNLTTVSCLNNTITSLNVTGLTNLNTLIAYNNQISNLDLSSNIALSYLSLFQNNLSSLNLSSNVALTSILFGQNNISAIDFSNNPALSFVTFDQGNISNIDFSTNASLTYLNCSNNPLVSLDLSNNTALTELYCTNTQLTSLNIQNGNNSSLINFSAIANSSLTCIQVSDVTYMNTTWSAGKDAGATYSAICPLPCVVNIPDANFKAALVADLSINTNADAEIQCAEASAFTGTINVTSLSVSDLTGIEAFTALTGLECALNNLTSIDLNSNTALLTVNCSGNPLGVINVANNTLLQTLQCHNTQLSNLDVSNNTNLNILDFSLNSISSIDLSNNISLITLFCGQNPLTSLNVSNNIALQNLYCEIAQLTGLNLTANTSLLNLNCSENSILALDLSTNTSLQTLDCAVNQLSSIDVSNNINLSSLSISFNNIASFDVTNNTLLESLVAINNSISSIDLSNNTLITTCSVSNNALSTLNIKNTNNNNLVFFEALNNPLLTCIQVDDATFMNTNWNSAKDAGATYNTSCACVVNIPDANFKAALVGNASINTNLDTEIQCTEASTFVGQIDVSSLGITDLTGIEAFTSLLDLRCQGNSLTTLDISSNTALTFLQCSYNDLTSLDVSSNTLLNYLQCDSNLISSLDLSNNPQLLDLRCNLNQLTTLDLSNNPSLLTLLCAQNNLSSINVSNCINLDVFDCAINQLTNLNISNNTQLTYLKANINQLTNIDLSANVILEQLNLHENQLTSIDVSTIPTLQLFYCAINQLTSLDVSNHLALYDLNCGSNFITSLNISNTPSIQYLNCFNNQLTAIDLSANNNLIFINCTGNNLSTLNVQNGNNINFTYFNATTNPALSCIQVDDATYMDTNWSGGKDAGATFSVVCPICVVNIPDVNFKAALVANLAINTNADAEIQCSEASSFTGTVNVFNQNISDLTGIEAFVAITGLEVSSNLLTSIDISANVALVSISCNNNNLTALDVSNQPALTDLLCYVNSINSIDVSNNPNLVLLNVGGNNLTTLDLSNNNNIGIFSCEDNFITSLDVSNLSLVQILRITNNPITSLNLTNCTSLLQFSGANTLVANYNLSSNTLVYEINAENNPQLSSLNIQNGNNLNLNIFNATNCPLLSCIQVDDPTFMNTNWSAAKDAGAAYNTSCACVVNIPDANFKAALVANTFINTNLDTEIQCSEASAYAGQLILNNLSIADLTGIEAFVNVFDINCSQNNISSIDISANTALQLFNCNGNSLSNLDVSANTNLTYLYCEVNNLSSLDITNNINLQQLRCSFNSISSLSVATNPNLIELSCETNNINSLDVSNNLNITNLNCQNNIITSLDLSLNSSLIIVNCSDNQLSSLNIQNGSNTSLTTFDATNNPLLNCILVDDVTYMNTNWSGAKDATAGYSIDCSCTVNIPDNNFRNALLANASININSDGVISCTEAAGFNGTLDVQVLGINDLTGIEAFVNLNTLICNGNTIPSIDLSSNTALVNLDVTNVGGLVSLNVTQNASLKTLYAGFNSLTTLDVSQNSLLEELNCAGNSLTVLDVTNNPLLKKLYCSNSLTSVDVTQNPLLEELDCTNPISGIDVTQNPLLRVLYVNFANFAALDLSQNTLLEQLYSSFGNITNLDLSNMPFLTTLDFRGNQCSSINVQNGNNSNLVSFDVTNSPTLNCIQVDDATFMNTNWAAAKDAGATYSVVCPLCVVTIPDANFKAALVADATINTNLDTEIQCSEATAYIGTINVDALGISDLTGIEAFVNIVGLDCSLNNLSFLDLSNNSALINLHCEDNNIFFLNINNCSNLLTLYCYNNNLGVLDVSNNLLLKDLYCENTNLSNIDVSNNSALEILAISMNSLSSLIVANNTLLKQLWCYSNNLSSLDLTNNLDLNTLNCYGNSITSLDLSTNIELVNLSCEANNLNDLNIQNGNNGNLVTFNATANPLLNCIQVDDATFMNTNWAAAKDAGATYSVSCNLFADFFADFTNVCQGATINFTDISAGTTGTTTYLWDFGDGNQSNTIGNVAHTYLTDGVFAVSLTITDGISSNQLFSNYITVNTTPAAPVLSVIDNCGSSEITATGIVGTLIWNDAGSGNPRTETTGTFTATQDVAGCISATSNSVTPNPFAIPNTSLITGNMIPNCSATGEVYSVALNAGSNYNWSVPAGAVITSGATGPDNHSITLDFATSNGQISVIETNASGCIGSSVDTLVNLQGCALAANFMADVTTICEGAPVTFTDLSTGTTGSTTYAWDFGTGANPPTASGAGPHQVFYNTAGAATVSLTVTEGASNNLTQSNFITVNTPTAPSISIVSDVVSPCPGTNINLTASITNPGSSYTVTWYRDGSSIGSGNSINTTVVNALEAYQAEYQTFDFCNSPQNALSNVINAAPQGLAGNPGLSGSAAACVGSPISFTGSYVIIFGPVNPVSYEWKVNGVIQASTTSPFVSSTLNNGDLIEGAMTYDDGCGLVNFNFGSVNAVVYPPITSLNKTIVNASCSAANGSYDVSGVAGGTAPYTYSTDGISYVGTTLFSGLTAGAYTIYVKDNNNCVYSEPFNINNIGGVTALTNNTTNATCGSSNGSYDVTGVTGGTAPYTYSTDGITYVGTTLFSGLSAGAYTIFVKDNNNCVYSEPFNINNIGGVTALTNNTTNATCGLSNGSYDVTGVTGGTAPYTYSTDGITYVGTTLFTGLAAGAYTIYVKDNNNCVYSEPFNINNIGAVTALTNNTTNATCGASNGSYDVTGVTGGTAPYTYSTDGITYVGTTLFSGLSAGAYTIYVKDNNNCIYSEPFNINNLGGVTALTNSLVDASCGASNGSYDITGVTGGTAPFTYSTDGITYVGTTLFSGLAAGAYTIYVKDNNNCIYSEPFNINNFGGVTALTNNTTNATCGSSNGSYDVTGVTGGTAPYIYSTDGITYVGTTLFTGLAAGAYTIYVKDNNNCVYSEPFNINNIGGVTALTNNTTNATCGSSNGSYDVTGVTGGTAPYTYSTDGLTYVGTTLFSGLSAGAYTIYVKDNNNCIYSEPFNINNIGGVTALTNNTTNATCGASNGSYDATGVTGGTAPYTYSTDGLTYVGTTLFSGLSAGAYTIYVKDNNNCVYSEPFNINNIGGVTALTNNTTNATCGSSNGSYDVTGVTGGTAPFTYSTDGITYVGTTLFSGLSAGAYTIYVKDNNNCVYSEPFNINNIGGVTALTNNLVDASCGSSNGSYDVTGVTGGSAPFTYSTDGITYVGTTLFSGLSAGAYTIYVKDNNNCIYSEPFNINNIGGVTALTNNLIDASCGSSNGSYDVTGVTGGTAPFTYSTDGITYVGTTLFSGLSAGAYTIYVKDNNNCVYSEPFNINNIGGVTALTNNLVDASCGSSNGSYDVTGVTGGTAPYTYSTDGITYVGTTLFSGLSAGAYTIYVKDNNNCVYSEPFNINNIGAVTALTNNTTNATCGSSNGSYDVTGVTGGTAPFTYSTDGLTYVGTTLFSGLSAGAYTIYVKDNNNCVYSEPFNINNIGGVTALTNNTTNATCGSSNGSYDVTGVTGGTAPYTYSTDGITYVGTTLFTGLAAGAYTIYVKDNNNCVYSEPFNINNIGAVTALTNNTTNATCGSTNGSYDVTGVTGGTAPYTYSTDGITYVGTTLFSGLSAGAYTIYVKDNNNCVYSEPFNINNIGGVTALTNNTTNATCGSSNGSYDVTSVTGGTAPFTYSTDGITYAGTTLFSGLSAGAYAIYVKDNNNCVYSEPFNINNLGGVTALTNNLVDATCGASNGSYDITGVTGGTAPFTYSTDGITYAGTTLFSGLSAGAYTIYVKDNNNCIYSEPFVINTSVIPVTSVVTGNINPICNETNVTYSVVLTSGSSYNWIVPVGAIITSGSTGPDNNSITVDFGSTNGNIDVVETNASGCIGTNQTLAINLQGCGLAANYNIDTDTICEGASVTFTDLSTGTTGSTTYFWDFGPSAVPSTITGAGPHVITYIATGPASVTLTITDGAVSTLTNSNQITVNPILTPSVSIAVSNSTICGPTVVDFTSNTVNGGANPVYQWQLNGVDIFGANSDTLSINSLVELDTISLNIISNEVCLSIPNASSNLIGINDSCDAAITTLPLPLNAYCAGSSIQVNYSVVGTVNPNNIFIAQLSDALGSFVSPTNIGQINSVISGTIAAVIPANTNPGAQYRIRVVSNSPAIAGSDNGADIAVNSINFGANFSIANLNLSSLPMTAQFNNNTPNLNQYTFTWFFGDGSQAIIDSFNVNYTYNYNGSYHVSLVATDITTGCTQTIYDTLNTILCSGFTTNACNHTASINAPNVINGCAGSLLNLSVNNFNPLFTYQWHRNGAVINGGNYETITVNTSGFYSVTVFDAAGCPKTSSPIQVSFNLPAVSPPTISISGQVGNCGLVNATLHANGNFAAYLWNTGTSADSVNISQAGIYSVIGQGALGCDAQSQPFPVSSSSLPTPNICMVTVDTLTNHHLLMWEKPITSQIQSFAIYKEIPFNSNNYLQIAVLPYDSLSEYIDTSSNAAIVTDRYRLSFIDTCNGETAYSDFVRAIGLKVFPGVGVQRVLSWNSYTGNFQNITSYLVYSGPDYSNMNIIGNVTPGAPPFIDSNPVAGINTVYRVQTELSQACESTRALRNRSQSNGTGNLVVTYPDAIKKLSSTKYKFNILPNPNNGNFIINWENAQIAPGASVWIENMYGQKVTSPLTMTENNTTISINVESGVYFIKVNSSAGDWVTQMVIVN